MSDLGYEICECKAYAHIYNASIVARLPDGYTGELCPQCKLWMCAVEKLPKSMTIEERLEALENENKAFMEAIDKLTQIVETQGLSIGHIAKILEIKLK